MGTNFYLMNGKHIGKRSAAGNYCWDCGVTLCGSGESKIHYCAYDKTWLDACPQCGAKPKEEGWNSSVGRELGFNKDKPQKKSGVASCSSFNWAIDEVELLRKRKVKDEYGDVFTLQEFKEILDECPVQYHHMIGQDFS
jgi:hypothetical protein